MSSGERIPLATAEADAEAFRALFDDCHTQWTIAGSVRRRAETVGDVEHVVIPRIGDVTGEGMFQETGNVLWDRMHLLGLPKAVYPDGKHQWGDKMRGVMFRGRRHEVFTAAPENWGAILAIRTGPAEFSHNLVTRLLAGGVYRQQKGCVQHVRTGSIHPVPTEQEFFRICGVPWTEPENRK